MMAARRASEVLLGGGIIAYPTEGVFGLGCLPDDIGALERVLAIKQRDPRKGLILIAAQPEQLDDWIDPAVRGALPEPDPRQPVTWIVRPAARVPALVTGDNPGLAGRSFGGLVDYVVPGECGPASGPSEIRELETGRVLRPGRS